MRLHNIAFVAWIPTVNSIFSRLSNAVGILLTPTSMRGYTIRLGSFRASDTTLDVPRRCPKASSSSRGYLSPITAHTEEASDAWLRIASAWFPGSTCEARQTDVFACEPPSLPFHELCSASANELARVEDSPVLTNEQGQRSCAPEKRRIRSPQLSAAHDSPTQLLVRGQRSVAPVFGGPVGVPRYV